MDYSAIIRAGVKNLESGGDACRAARRSRSSSCARSTSRTPSATSSARSARRSWPRSSRTSTRAAPGKNWILREYLNSVPYGTNEGRTSIGIEAAAADLLLEAREEPRPRRVGAARRPAAGAVAVQPVPQPDGGARAPQRGAARRWPTTASSPSPRPSSASRAAARPEARHPPLHDAPRAVLLRLRRGAADRGVRRRRLPPRRAEDPHDDRPEAAGRGPRRDQRRTCRTRPTRARRSSRSTPPPATSRRWPRAAPTRTATFNLAAQGHRQPGSAFKTFVLVTALRQGVDPNSTTYTSKPLDLDRAGLRAVEGLDLRRQLRRHDEPRAGDARARTTPSTRSSTSTSGPKNVRETAEMMGITTQLDGLPAEGLGGLRLGVSPLEMANAYATLASCGIHSEPKAITKVEFPDGKTDELGKPKRKRVFPEWVAYEATKILEQNVQGGTGTAAQHRLRRRRQDRHDRQLQRRVVRRLHAPSRGVGLGRLSERARRDAQRARHQRRRRHVPGADLAVVHDGREGRRTATRSARPWTSPSSRPFYGKYASTGTSADASYSYDDSYSTAPAPATTRGRRRAAGGYDPRLYESPPQEAPEPPAAARRTTAAAAPHPATGMATAFGHGNGNGQRASDRAALGGARRRSASSTSRSPRCRRPTARTSCWRPPAARPTGCSGRCAWSAETGPTARSAGRSSTPGCGSRSRSGRCVVVARRRASPRARRSRRVVARHAALPAGAAAPVAGRLLVHRLRAARRRARPQPVRARSGRHPGRRRLPVRRLEDRDVRVRAALHAA